MKFRYRDDIQHLTREDLFSAYPEVSERVFKLVQDLTPAIVALEVKERGGFNMQGFDPDTRRCLLGFMKQHFNQGAYDVFTEDELAFMYERFRHLYFTSLMITRGVFIEGTDESGVFWERVTPVRKPQFKPRTIFRARDIYTGMWLGGVKSKRLF